MNRDNVLYVMIGLLAGFIAGYVMHEMMAARQPARLLADGTLVGGAPGVGVPGGGNPAAQPAQPGQPGQAPQTPTGGGAPSPMVAQLQQRLMENPDDTEVIKTLADLNYDIQNWSRAIELYGRYLELRPDDVDTMTDLGACYRNQGDARRALELFKQVRTLDPGHWQARYNEVLVLAFDLQDLAEARRQMGELQAMQPDNPEVARLADALERQAGA